MHKHIQSINGVYVNTTDFVRLRLNSGWDYIWFAFHEEKGAILIASSYGTWSYIWNAMGEGVKLSEFFQKANNDYLANKLIDRRDIHSFHSGDAIKDIKKLIIEERRLDYIGSAEARELMDAVKELDVDLDSNWEHDQSRFQDAFYQNDTLREWKEEFWEYSWGLRPNSKLTVLKEEIIPLIKQYFKGDLTKSTGENAVTHG